MLYKLNKKEKFIEHFLGQSSLSSIGFVEKDLENILARDIDILTGENLMVIFQETNWKAEPDILAVDKDGKVWIFELKRWAADVNAIHQLLRYSHDFGQLKYDKLNEYFLKHKQKKIDNQKSLRESHQEYFGLNESLSEKNFNAEQVLVVVSDGLDSECYNAVQYWNKKSLDVRYISTHVYKISGDEYAIEFSHGEQLGGGCWMINTNGTECEKDMLTNEKAAAYSDPWKFKIQKLNKGDRVFLYSNKKGIVATGLVKDNKPKMLNAGVQGEDEYYAELESFQVATKPLPAGKIKTLLDEKKLNDGKNLNYRLTLVSLKREVAEELLKNLSF